MMKLIFPVLLIVSAFLLTPLQSTEAAAAEEKTCYFVATLGDVFITVNEMEPGVNRDVQVWEGLLKNGQEQMVKCKTGKVSYQYKPANEDRTYGDNHASCQNGSIIRVP